LSHSLDNDLGLLYIGLAAKLFDIQTALLVG
jgi:hypothetical protein